MRTAIAAAQVASRAVSTEAVVGRTRASLGNLQEASWLSA